MLLFNDPRFRPLLTKARFFVEGQSDLLRRLGSLEYTDTSPMCGTASLHAEAYLEALKPLKPQDKVHVLMRELRFYQDGNKFWDPLMESFYEQTAKVKRQVIALYLREAIIGLNEAGIEPAEQLRLEKLYSSFDTQAWFLRYIDNTEFSENFERCPKHGHLMLKPRANITRESALQALCATYPK